MPLPNDGITPDRFELWARFVSGAVVGALAAAGLIIGAQLSVPVSVLAVAAGALVFGLLACRYGDRFWRWIRWL